MSDKLAYEPLDRELKYPRGSNKHMGGVTFVMAGDFRQTFPIVPRSPLTDELNACVK